jgi:hypothetical protein
VHVDAGSGLPPGDRADLERAVEEVMREFCVSRREAVDAIVRCSVKNRVELAEVARILVKFRRP